MALDTNTNPDQAQDQTVPLQVAGVNTPPVPSGNVPPQAQAPTQTAPVTTQPQPQLHEKIFSNVLKTLGGGGNRPVRDAAGNPVTDESGNVVMAPTSKKTLAASILAGALAGLAQGFTEMPRYGGKGVGYVGPNIGAAAEKGLAAGQQFTQQGQQAAAQKQADDLKLRQYTTMKQNYDQHAMAFAMHHQDEEAVQEAIDKGSFLVNGVRTAGLVDEKGNPIPYDPNMDYVDTDGLNKFLADHKADGPTRYTAVPVDQVPVVKNGKSPGNEVRYLIIDNHARMKVTDEMKQAYPSLSAVDTLPVYAATQMYQNAGMSTIVGNEFAKLAKAQTDFKKGTKFTLDVPQLLRDSHITPNSPKMQAIMGLAPLTDNPDLFLEKLSAIDGGLAARVTQRMQDAGYNSQDWVDKRKGDAASEGLIEGPIKDLNNANAILVSKNPLVTEARKDEAQAFVQNQQSLETDKLNRTTLAAEQREAAKQADKDRREMGYVEAQDGSGDVYHVSRYEAEHNPQYSAQTFEPLKPSDVKKDRDAIKPVNDIQLNINGYRDANSAYASSGLSQAQVVRDRDNLRTIFSSPEVTAAAGAHAEAGGFGFSIPTVSADLNKSLAEKVNTAYNGLSPQAKSLADSYIRLRGAIPAYVKVLTNTGRSNKEQLDLELQNIQLPYYDQKDIASRLERFQGNLDIQKNGFPKNLPGGRFAPASASSSGPKAGDVKSYGGANYKFDGKQWVKQ